MVRNGFKPSRSARILKKHLEFGVFKEENAEIPKKISDVGALEYQHQDRRGMLTRQCCAPQATACLPFPH